MAIYPSLPMIRLGSKLQLNLLYTTHGTSSSGIGECHFQQNLVIVIGMSKINKTLRQASVVLPGPHPYEPVVSFDVHTSTKAFHRPI